METRLEYLTRDTGLCCLHFIDYNRVTKHNSTKETANFVVTYFSLHLA